MSNMDNFDIYAGGKSGVFKGIKIGEAQPVMRNIQSLLSITIDDEVTTISWGDDEKDILIACGVKENRSVKVYDTECSAFTCSFFCNEGTGPINGISRYDGAILTAVESGEVKLWRYRKEDEILLKTGANLHRMRHSKANKNTIATGGLEHKLKLFDLERQAQTFIEKELPQDQLQLRVPIWISDIGFLPDSEQIVTAGRYGHVRLYDPKAQRRPVTKIVMKDEAFNSLAITPREKQIIVGSGKGRMNLIDLRKPGKILNTYKGSVGGITGIACSTTEPYVASVGLDRYLRIHHIDTKQLLKKIYLTSKMTCMLLRSGFSLPTQNESTVSAKPKDSDSDIRDASTEERNNNQDVESDVEYDMLFDAMPVIKNKEDKKKRNIEEDSPQKENALQDLGQRTNGKPARSNKKLKTKSKKLL